MKVAIIGAGQMGAYYAANLIEKQGCKPEDIAIHDVVAEKAERLAAKYGAVYTEMFPYGCTVGIVAASTPAHAGVIEKLAKAGAERILTEKPLVFKPHELRKIAQYRPRTALVINFSPTLTALKKIMDSSGTELLEFYGSWGKPRPLDKNPRPSAGDVEDESIHPIAFAHELLRGSGSRSDCVTVCARVSELPFVDPKVQAAARENDISFPSQPNHSTTALLTYCIGERRVPVDIRSSFLLAKQERKVGGILGHPEKPAYLFEVEFDLKGDGGTFDKLTLVDLAQKDTRVEQFPCDKLNDLTRAFVQSDTNTELDPRLANFTTGSFLVKLQNEILESAQYGRTRRINFT